MTKRCEKVIQGGASTKETGVASRRQLTEQTGCRHLRQQAARTARLRSGRQTPRRAPVHYNHTCFSGDTEICASGEGRISKKKTSKKNQSDVVSFHLVEGTKGTEAGGIFWDEIPRPIRVRVQQRYQPDICSSCFSTRRWPGCPPRLPANTDGAKQS